MEMNEREGSLDLALGWGIDIVPMLNVATFEFTCELMDPSGAQHPRRQMEPMAMTLDQLLQLQKTLPELIAEMRRLGCTSTHTAPSKGGPGSH